MTLEWVAERLKMGAPTHLAFFLQREKQKGENIENTLF
jgi:hypothetical protein